MNLGSKIKFFRKNKNMTIKQLAEATKLSSGFISNIERDLNSPSISNLQQICEVLEINVVDLIQEKEDKSYIVRNSDRKEIFKSDDDTVKFELVSNQDRELNVICIKLKPNSQYESTDWGHTFDEIGLVIKGILEIKVDNNVNVLKEGDSIYINKYTPHNYKNGGSEECIIYWFSVKK